MLAIRSLFQRVGSQPRWTGNAKMARGTVLKSAWLDVAKKGQEKADGDKFQVLLKGLIYLQETVHRRLEIIIIKQRRSDKIPSLASQVSGCVFGVGGGLSRSWKPITPISTCAATRLSVGLLTFVVVVVLRFHF